MGTQFRDGVTAHPEVSRKGRWCLRVLNDWGKCGGPPLLPGRVKIVGVIHP